MWLVQMNEQEHQALMNPIRIQSGWRTRGTGKGPTQKARRAPEGLTVLLGEQPKCRDGNDLGWGWLSNQSSEQPGSSDQKTESSPRKAWRLGVEKGTWGASLLAHWRRICPHTACQPDVLNSSILKAIYSTKEISALFLPLFSSL